MSASPGVGAPDKIEEVVSLQRPTHSLRRNHTCHSSPGRCNYHGPHALSQQASMFGLSGTTTPHRSSLSLFFFSNILNILDLELQVCQTKPPHPAASGLFDVEHGHREKPRSERIPLLGTRTCFHMEVRYGSCLWSSNLALKPCPRITNSARHRGGVTQPSSGPAIAFSSARPDSDPFSSEMIPAFQPVLISNRPRCLNERWHHEL